jgi:hypothetical protein
MRGGLENGCRFWHWINKKDGIVEVEFERARNSFIVVLSNFSNIISSTK